MTEDQHWRGDETYHLLEVGRAEQGIVDLDRLGRRYLSHDQQRGTRSGWGRADSTQRVQGGPGKDGEGLVPRSHDPFISTSAEFEGTGCIEPRLGVKRSTQLKESAYDLD
jgi:hypothetical protein